MIRTYIVIFAGPSCYFKDNMDPHGDDLIDTSEYLSKRLTNIADAIEKLQLDENWEMEYYRGDISLRNDRIEDKEKFFKYIEELNIDKDLFYFIDLKEL